MNATLYHHLTSASMDAYFVVDIDGRVLQVNDAASSMYGYSKEELLALSLCDIEAQENMENIREHIKKIMHDGYDRFESRHYHKDGTLLEVEISVTYVQESQCFLGFHRDITARKKAQQELEYIQQCFNEALNSPQHVLYRLNVKAGCYDYLSPTFEKITGYPVATFKNTSLETLRTYCHPDDLNRALPLLEQAFQTRTGPSASLDLEYRLRKADGEYCWLHDSTTACFDESGELAYFYGTAHDITKRMKAELLLRERESFLTKVQQTAQIGIYEFDVVQDEWTSSPELDEIFGMGESFERNIHGWLSLVHEDCRDEMAAYFNALLVSENWFDMEYKIVRPSDGQERWVYGTGEFEYDPAGKPLRMFGTIQDITERKKAEASKLALEQQLLHAQKLESLGVLAGGIAHDFNNILTAIVGNTELVLLQLPPDSPFKDNLLRVERAAVRATDLARQMLAYSGKGKFVIESINLNHLLEEMGRILEVSISKRVALRYNLTGNIPPVHADATQIRQVLMNLVINASEAIGDADGVVAISTGTIKCSSPYLQEIWSMDSLPEGLYVFVEVADTGCGMTRTVIDKLFDPFFTTKFTGRGLGMASVLGIVRGHHGAIKVQSEVGKGTTFQILLPASTLVHNDPAAVGNTFDWRGHGIVLLVDDEETVREIGRDMLQRLGYAVITARNGLEAVDIFRSHTDISLVILDLTMPLMDGMQCVKALRALQPEIPILMSSGFNEQEVAKQSDVQGLAGFIQKPYRLADLKGILAKL